MESPSTADDRGDRRGSLARMFDPEELRRRNLVSLGMDVLILATTGLLAILFTMGLWPAVIGAVPMAALLYFGWASSKAFFVAQALAVAVALLGTVTGVLPY
ncbi:hypothetical protein DVK05_14850 [Halorubrum sp. Atlit-8R]|uniref:Uncharacterized protein n=1 Tax=Halorubrum salinarum TaxID=2739057 RepID=A0A7D3Y252_9EURY|nr:MULTISPECIES: hypothetical protein [Halorubrum]TKX85952.1 hypothetical protein EXE43_10930 [Halorubrum sp. SS5]QKG93847.1 hypothetical protein HPS36_13620 [Halorubrum salinarum]RLM63549.1 hypothetical protein DVK08_16595 [Halorubrum sp. Atlit-9R]RLM77025.1 hypothetical protein DVK05_14850 [Halorubrum sp. Atlit-8R]TKX59002.1 hypothetical protein EXE44_05505 [Halorubrum sp. SS7]